MADGTSIFESQAVNTGWHRAASAATTGGSKLIFVLKFFILNELRFTVTKKLFPGTKRNKNSRRMKYSTAIFKNLAPSGLQGLS